MAFLDKPNYQAWQVAEREFPASGDFLAQASFILRYAILAPSAHNTQPWLFKISPNSLEIFIDKTRALLDSDPALRQTYESLGACVENLVIAAEYFGFLVEVKTSLETPVEEGEKIKIARLILTKAAGPKKLEELFSAITKRHSAKLAYTSEKIPESVFAELSVLNDFPDLAMQFFSNSEALVAAVEAVGAGTAAAFADKTFCTELLRWLRPNWTSKPDGMPGFTVGMPGPVSWLAPKLMARFNTGPMQVKMMRKVMATTPVFGVISGFNITANWFSAGRLYERIALALTQKKVNSAIMGAPVEVEAVAAKLQRDLALLARPLLFFRVGKSKSRDLFAPRRALNEVVFSS